MSNPTGRPSRAAISTPVTRWKPIMRRLFALAAVALAALALYPTAASAQCPPPPLLQPPPLLAAPVACQPFPAQAVPVVQGVAFYPPPAVAQFPTFAPQTAYGWPQTGFQPAATCSGGNCGQSAPLGRRWFR